LIQNRTEARSVTNGLEVDTVLPMTTPMDVWRHLERADERVKYAQNRDAADAYRQARESLDLAASEAMTLDDERARIALTAQIQKRLDDITRLETETSA
jgi:hypothetical protein